MFSILLIEFVHLYMYDQNLSRHHSTAQWFLVQYIRNIVKDVTSRLSYWEFLLRKKTFDKLTYINYRRNSENFRTRSFIAVTPGNRYSWTVTSLLRTHSITCYFSSFNSLTTGHRTLFIRENNRKVKNLTKCFRLYKEFRFPPAI